MTARFTVIFPGQSCRSKLTSHESAPRRERKHFLIWPPDSKVVKRLDRASWLRFWNGLPQRSGAHAATRRRAPRLKVADRLGPHKGAGADAAEQDTFRDESLVYKGDCVARHLEVARQLTRRRQSFTRTKATIENRIEQLPINTRRQIAPTHQRDVNIHTTQSYWPSRISQDWLFDLSNLAGTLALRSSGVAFTRVDHEGRIVVREARIPRCTRLVDDAAAAFRELSQRADVTLPLTQRPYGKVFGIAGAFRAPRYLSDWPGNDQAVPWNECGASASSAGSCYLGRERSAPRPRRPQRSTKAGLKS